MKKIALFFCALTITTAIAGPVLQAEDGVCHRCEVIREQNKTQHHNYEYYEDYLKSEGKGQSQTSTAPAAKHDNTSKKNSNGSNNSTKNTNKSNNNNNTNNNNNKNNNSQNNGNNSTQNRA